MYEINSMPKSLILGYFGESNIKEFEVDCTDWLTEWPNGAIAVTYQAPSATSAYALPPSQSVVSEGILTIIVRSNMTSEAGSGTLNIRLVDDNATPEDLDDDIGKRSVLIRTTVLESHETLLDEAPDIVQDWVDEATITIQEALASTRYLHIMYSVTEPDEDKDVTETPSAWIGICHTASNIAPTSYLEYDWNPLKSIQSVERVTGDGSAGTTDTYRITFTDTSTLDYDVVHGNGIATIVRTSGDGSEGTTDTYTITFDNGTITTFTVTHGNDSFVHIKYSNYPVPTDGQMTDDPDSVYMGICTDINEAAPTTAISYAWSRIRGETGATGEAGADGAQGPQGIQGPAGADGAQGPAGADGDDGASAYVHIKYSLTQPDENADMTDVPSDWLGVYSGTSATAPVAYTDYDWYNIKGATGATGAAGATGADGAAGADGTTPVADVDYPSVASIEADVDDSIQDALADYVAVSDIADAFACDIASKKAINFSFTISNTDAKEITFTNEPTGRCEVFLEITTSAAPGAITWTLDGGSLAWSTGSAPVMVTGKIYRILFFTSDGGTNWDAFASVGV